MKNNKNIGILSAAVVGAAAVGVSIPLMIKRIKIKRQEEKASPVCGRGGSRRPTERVSNTVAYQSENGEADITQRHQGVYEKYVKRFLDIACASGALIILSPVYAGVAIAVKTKLGSPVIFTQERPGKDEKIFKLYKFRTMTDERDENGELLPDEVRLTKFGKWLRSTSLDELPEMWNILKGDMSFVGPRPLAVVYLPFYTESEHHRHDVRPGLTGLAQVNGRNNLNWEEKFEYDIQYVRNISFKVDCQIIFKTVKKVFSHEGIGQGEEAPESLHVLRKQNIDRG